MKYISKERAKQLEESMGWLTNYTTPKEEKHIVGESLDNKDEEYSKLLEELGQINLRKYEIIKKFML